MKMVLLVALVLLPTACEKIYPTEKGSIVETSSGLIYEVIEEGKGATPNAEDYVTVHYKGTLEDGTQFDSSYDRGEPATFPANGVIPGWVEALSMMKEGSKWSLTIPPELGYGPQGAAEGKIPPNAVLNFVVELVKVQTIDDLMAAFEAQQPIFLEDNAKQEGVTVLDSGLQYMVESEGEGPKPASASANVTVHYEGRLINGHVFDSSHKRGKPSTFPLNRVIKGWTEGLQLMNVGGRYTFFIPAALAYGPNGSSSGSVPPNATLIFDVELIAIEG